MRFAIFFFVEFQPESAGLALVLVCFGGFPRYRPSRRELARFYANWPEFALSQRESGNGKKKIGRGTDRQAVTSLTCCRVGHGCGGHFAASVHLRL